MSHSSLHAMLLKLVHIVLSVVDQYCLSQHFTERMLIVNFGKKVTYRNYRFLVL